MISIGLIIMIYIVQKTDYDITHVSVPYWIMLSVTVLTAISGVRYVIGNLSLFMKTKQTSSNGEAAQ